MKRQKRKSRRERNLAAARKRGVKGEWR